MAKILAETDVELHIVFTGYSSSFRFSQTKPEELERRAVAFRDEFDKLVRRHVVPHAGGEFHICDMTKRNYTCSGCGSNWTEKSNTFNGGCCDADMEHDPEQVAALAHTSNEPNRGDAQS